MSDQPVAPFIVPAFDGTGSIRDWHIQFATANVEALTRLKAMAPARVVVIMIDMTELKPRVSFRTEQNVIAILPPEDADAVAAEKIIVISDDRSGSIVATRFRISCEPS